MLDTAAWSALTGPHAGFAETVGRVVRYRPDVSPFLALPPDPGPQDWADAATLAGPGGSITLTLPATPPPGWVQTFAVAGVQLLDGGVRTAPDAEALVLGEDDVPEMLDLVARTRPGPFLPRTHTLGGYLGIRRGGVLVAMAGERMHPPGHAEISAICTDAAHRGQGLGTRLVRAVADGIRARGETPFLHTGADNLGAIALYESLGFRLRRHTTFASFQAPAGPGGDGAPLG